MAPLIHEDADAKIALTEEESVLRIGYLEKVDSLNPLAGWNDVSSFFYSLVYDSLFSIGNDMETVGNLALEWRAVPLSDPEMMASGDPYGSVWEYNVTTNAKWHDGEPFTAVDVVWNINLQADNYNTFWSHQPYTFFIDYAELVDDDTVRVHCYNRSTNDPMPVAFGDSLFIPMLPRHLLEGASPFYIAFSWNGTFGALGPPLVGTGPFTGAEGIYEEWLEGEHLTLVRNPDYHWAVDKGLEVQFDKIVMSFFDDPTAMQIALQTGDLDVAQFPPSNYDALKDNIESGAVENVETFEGLKVNGYFTKVGINMNDAGPNPSRLDPAVRQALAMATNKTYIAETYYRQYAEPGTTLISPFSEDWHYEPTAGEVYQYDLDAAAQLLEDSGYRYTPESPEVRVATADSLAVQEGWVAEGTQLSFEVLVRREMPEEGDIAVFLSYVWWAIGVDLNPMVWDESTMSTIVWSYTYDMAIWCWSSDPDPNHMLFRQSRYSINGWSDNVYSDQTYNDNYNASVAAMEYGNRKVYVDNCQRQHYLDAAYIVLAYPYQTYAWRTDTFYGWGDWAADPGRSLDAYWGANPILFDLAPIPPENSAPASVALDLPDGDVYVGLSYEFVVSAYDADMDDLAVEIDYGDGTSEQEFLTGTSTSYEFAFWHVYESADDYELYVTVDDQSGNASHVAIYGPVPLSVLDDENPPVTSASLDGIEGENGWYLSEVEVTLTATDDETGVDVTEWRLGGASPWTEYDDSVVVDAEGLNDFEFRSIDLAGNVEVMKLTTVKIDLTVPTLEADHETGFTATSSTVVIGLEYSDAVSGVDHLGLSVDGAEPTDIALAPEVTLGNLTDGEHRVQIWVFDKAGQPSSSILLEFEVETSIFALDGPAGPWIVIGMIVAILAVIAVAAFLLMRGMKPPQS